MFKWVAGLSAVAMGLAVATAFSSSAPEVIAKKGDRLDIRPASSMNCPKLEWPYGCQWDASKSRRAEGTPSATRKLRSFRSRAAAGAKARRIAVAAAVARATSDPTNTR
jgi:hypothetical protein